MRAECYKRSSMDPMRYDHPAPFENCSCGIYGFYEYEELLPRLHEAVGVVKYWGECQAHQTGLRAEHARVVAVAPTWLAGIKSSGRFFHIFLTRFLLFFLGLLIVLILNFTIGFSDPVTAHHLAVDLMIALVITFFMTAFLSLLLRAYRIKRWSTRHRAHFHLFPRALRQYHTHPMPQCFRCPKASDE
jgi:hypothetical protein